MSSQHHYLIKYLVVGDSMCGKTAILLRFTDGRYQALHESTIGSEFSSKTITVNDKLVKLQCWDTAGQESYRSLTKSYFRGAAVILLVFDLTQRSSFDDLDSWLKDCNSSQTSSTNKPIIYLLGNKSDLAYRRRVTEEEAKQYAEDRGLIYVETSAKEDKNITEVFENSCKQILEKIEKGEIEVNGPGSGVRAGGLLKTEGEDDQKLKENKSKCC